jgi:hypothetical protein
VVNATDVDEHSGHLRTRLAVLARAAASRRRADVRLDPRALTLRRVRQLGFAGSCALLVGSFLAGVLPWQLVLQLPPSLLHIRDHSTFTVAVVFAGLALLLLAWWRLGLLIHGRGRLATAGLDDLPETATPSTWELAKTLAWWCAPLIGAAPLFSRDVYSYIAQGAMTVQGIDSYTFGPAYLGAPLALDVPAIWLYTPAPYGPVFLTLAAKVTTITENSTDWGILGMRVLALASIAVLVLAVPVIARECKVNPASALWLGVLNPLVVLHLAGDSHNDSVMLALMAGGIALALRRRYGFGVVLITLAALVKAPAALALVFLMPLWVARSRKPDARGPWLRVGLIMSVIVAVTVVVTTIVAGTGYGWVGALGTPAIAHTWTSIVTDLGYWTGLLVTAMGVATLNQALWVWRTLGLLAAALICLEMLRRSGRVHPVVGLGIGMSAVVILGPVMHPWYLLWAMLPLAIASRDRRIRRIVIGSTLVFTLCVLPGGANPDLHAVIGAVIGVILVLLVDRAFTHPEWRARAASVLLTLRQVVQREPVAVHPQTTDHTGSYRRDHRVVPELLPRVDVRDVHLDERRAQESAGVAERVRVMGPRPGVEHDRGGVVGGLVQPGDHLRFGVSLSDLDLEAELLADPHTGLSEVGVRGQSVDVGLSRTEPTQVGSVEDKHLHDETSR